MFLTIPTHFLLVDGKGAAKKESDTTGEPTGKTEAEGEGEKKAKFELPEEFTDVSPSSCAQTRTCLHEFSPSNFALDFYVSCSHWDAALVNT